MISARWRGAMGRGGPAAAGGGAARRGGGCGFERGLQPRRQNALAAGYSGGQTVDHVGGAVLWDAAARLASGGAARREGEPRRQSVAFSPDGKTVAAGYGGVGSGVVVLWDTAMRQRLAETPLSVKEDRGIFGEGRWGPTTAGRSPRIAGSPRGVALGRGDAATAAQLVRDQLPVVREGSVTSVAFSPDGKTLAAGYEGNSLLRCARVFGSGVCGAVGRGGRRQRLAGGRSP